MKETSTLPISEESWLSHFRSLPLKPQVAQANLVPRTLGTRLSASSKYEHLRASALLPNIRIMTTTKIDI